MGPVRAPTRAVKIMAMENSLVPYGPWWLILVGSWAGTWKIPGPAEDATAQRGSNWKCTESWLACFLRVDGGVFDLARATGMREIFPPVIH